MISGRVCNVRHDGRARWREFLRVVDEPFKRDANCPGAGPHIRARYLPDAKGIGYERCRQSTITRSGVRECPGQSLQLSPQIHADSLQSRRRPVKAGGGCSAGPSLDRSKSPDSQDRPC